MEGQAKLTSQERHGYYSRPRGLDIVFELQVDD
jgi:hypothetical protein